MCSETSVQEQPQVQKNIMGESSPPMKKLSQRDITFHPLPVSQAAAPKVHPFPDRIWIGLWSGVVGGALVGLLIGDLLFRGVLHFKWKARKHSTQWDPLLPMCFGYSWAQPWDYLLAA